MFRTPVDQLWQMVGGAVSREYLTHIWKRECDMDTEAAANRVADLVASNALKEHELAWKAEKRERLQFAERVGIETPAAKGCPHPVSRVVGDATSVGKVRYLNGEVVTTKGDKYIVEKPKEWDGGSRGRVKTKGKRGKGFV